MLVWSANQEKGLEVKLSTTNSDYPGGVDVVFVAIENWKKFWFYVLQRHETDLNVLCFYCIMVRRKDILFLLALSLTY